MHNQKNQDGVKQAFLNCSYAPDANLCEEVWQKIIQRNKRIIYFKLTTLSVIGGVSLFSLVEAFKMLLADLSQSGFYQYLSMMLGSGGSAFNYWKEFLSILAESLPIMSLTLSLALLFVFFLSLKYLVKQIIRNQLTVSY